MWFEPAAKNRFGENATGGRFLCPKLNNLWEKQLWEASQVIKEALLRASINHFTFRAKKGFGRSTHANGTIAQCTHVKTFFGARHCWIVLKVTKYHRLGFSRIFGFVGFSPFSNLFLMNLTISPPSRFRCYLYSISFGLFTFPLDSSSHQRQMGEQMMCRQRQTSNQCCSYNFPLWKYICNLVSEDQLVWSPGDISPPILL